MDKPIGLDYIGHPIVDVGLAVCAEMAGKKHPKYLTRTDMVQILAKLREYYEDKVLQGFLMTVFPNFVWFNEVYNRKRLQKEGGDRLRAQLAQKRAEEEERICKSILTPEGDDRCVFCGAVAFDRLYRERMPILTGGDPQTKEKFVNFFSRGVPGLPVCGPHYVAVLAFPFGTLRCDGRLLLVLPEGERAIWKIARWCLTKWQKASSLPAGAKFSSHFFKTRLLQVLQWLIEEEEKAEGAVGYHITNYGTNADVDEYVLPLEVLSFLQRVLTDPDTSSIWKRIEAKEWWVAGEKEQIKEAEPIGDREVAYFVRQTVRKKVGEYDTEYDPDCKRRNALYEALVKMAQNPPRESRHFIRRFILRLPWLRATMKGDLPLDEIALIRWEIARMFCEEVLGMDRERLDMVRNLADRLAKHIQKTTDTKAFKQILYQSERDYRTLRTVLLRVDERMVRNGEEPLLRFDEYVRIFEEAEGMAHRDWRLARDLLLIRLIEKLYESGWFQKEDVRKEVEQEAEREEEE